MDAARKTRLAIVESLLEYATAPERIDRVFEQSSSRSDAVARLLEPPFSVGPEAADHIANAPLWLRTREGRTGLEQEVKQLRRLLSDGSPPN